MGFVAADAQQLDFEAIPILLDDESPPSRRRSRLERPTPRCVRPKPCATIRVDENVEIILDPTADLSRGFGARPQMHRSLPALYLEPHRVNMSRHCTVCRQQFRSGDLRVGFMQEPQLLPQWVHLCCTRRARLRSIGRWMAHHPQVTEAELEEALDTLGRPGGSSNELQPWNYLAATVHEWTTTLLRERGHRSTVAALESEREIADVLATLPCEQLQESHDSCAICHQTLDVGEMVCRLPCEHVYHVGCIDAWLRIRTTCPLDNQQPYPERFTNDFFRDSLPELEFKLEEACVKGSIQEVHDLILKGADKDAPLDQDLKTPLMIACQLGWFHLVKWLVEFEEVDMDGPMSRCGFRAMDYAGKEQFRWPNEEVEIADYLRSMGSNYSWWGACFAGDIPRIDEYLQNGQDINEINPVLWNYNAVDCALHGGCAKAAQFLVARGGMITVRNCHVPVWEDMLWSLGRGDAFMYKEWGIEEGAFTKL
ncbi:unnamed protein product [Effrenium voratum]|nr:unnamed protein product [Effrenium voratum]